MIANGVSASKAPLKMFKEAKQCVLSIIKSAVYQETLHDFFDK